MASPAGPRGWGSASTVQLRSSELCNWWWARGILGAVLGTATGWLTAACSFPGRRILRIAQLIPLAFPAYLLAASLIDWGSHHGLRVHGVGWALILLTLTTYSYVFLLSTESFSISGKALLEASRSLGGGAMAQFLAGCPADCPALDRSRCGPERDGGGQ